MKKNVGILAVFMTFTFFSCKENVESKISEADLIALEKMKADVTTLPVLELDKTMHDFGKINEGDVVETEFLVTNTGKTDLIIADAKGSCGCTVPDWPKEPIAPGTSAPIKVSFNSSGKPGNQSKTVTLTTNTAKGNELFSIKADVNPKNPS